MKPSIFTALLLYIWAFILTRCEKDDMYGISNLSSIPVRTEPAEKSEMCTQILFGEHYTVLEETAKWARIQLQFDGYEGWIDRKMVTPLQEREFKKLSSKPQVVTSEIFNIAQQINHYRNFLIVAGSTLPHFRYTDKSFKLAGTDFKIEGGHFQKNKIESKRSQVVNVALRYFNAPYLWGGRTPLGIDCSGLSQIAYKVAGFSIPRDARDQAGLGEHFSFVEEALPGDLAFFDNENGEIIHVGIIWEKNKIIHSSGKVRIDNLDHAGIYNIESKRYTHQLRLMKRILPEE